MFQHGVDDGDQLAHAGSDGQFLGFARSAKALMKAADHRIKASDNQGCYIQRRTHRRTTTPNGPLSTHNAAVPVERRYSYQSRDLLAVQSAQLRQFRQQGEGEDGTNPGNTPQQVLPFSPERALSYCMVEFLIQCSQLLLQPSDMLLDPWADTGQRSAQAISLGSEHNYELSSAGQESTQRLGLDIRQGSGRGTHPLCEEGKRLGIREIGLG